jgi:hypothetical protein
MAIIITTVTRATDIITDIRIAMRSMEIVTRDGTNRTNLKATVSTEGYFCTNTYEHKYIEVRGIGRRLNLGG